MGILDIMNSDPGAMSPQDYGLFGALGPLNSQQKTMLLFSGLKDALNAWTGRGNQDNLQNTASLLGAQSRYARQNQAYQKTLDTLTAPSQIADVTVTPQMKSGQTFDPTLPQYNQPFKTAPGPLNGSPMADLLRSMPADQGIPSLMSMMGPHKIDTVTDAQGVPHLIDSVTGADRGTIGGPKPFTFDPTKINYLPTNMLGNSGPKAPNIQSAITAQESGGNPNIGTSVDGAVGAAQILPQTFAQYALPGENINNPADNAKVQGRILDDYSAKFGNDPARIAVAYFSGPNNVAPPGSTTPWLKDAKDGNGKSVSSYVSDVLGRLGGGQQDQSAPNIPGFTAIPAKPANRPMTQAELKQYNALPGSTINTATGEVQRATAYNSPAAMDAGTLDGLAAQYNLTGHLPAGMGRGGYAAQQVLARADALVPPDIRDQGPQAIAQWRAQNAQNYVSQGASIKNFDQGKLGNTVRSFSVGLSHIDTLKKTVSALGNGDNQSFNKLKNAIANWTGQPAPNNFDAVRNIVADEISKAIIGGATALGDRDAAKATINNAQSPQQLLGVLSQYEDLMGGQLKGLAQQYQVATGRKDFASRLSPEAQRVFGFGNGKPQTPINPSTLPRKGAPQIIKYDAQGNRIQ